MPRQADRPHRQFRLDRIEKDGIPEDMLDVNKWTIEPEQVLGGGSSSSPDGAGGASWNQIRRTCRPPASASSTT